LVRVLLVPNRARRTIDHALAASSNEAFGLALSSNRTVTALKATAMRDDDDRRPPEAMHADAGNEDKSTSFAKNSG